MTAACTVDAVIGLFGVTGSLLQMASKTRRVGKAIQIAAKIDNGGIGLYRNATTFGKSAVDFYMRHEGTFFTKDFRWELADAGDFLSMAVSGIGATTSAAGMASGISDAAKTYRQWKKIDALKNIGEGGLDSSNPFYKQGGGSDLDDFMTLHAEKHAYNPDVKSTRNRTQFGENVDVVKLREDTLLHPDTPTGSHRVFINLDPKAGKTNRNSQFPYYRDNK